MAERVEVFQTEAGKWGWRHITRNENIVSTDGGQGYENKLDAVRMARQENPDVPLYVIEAEPLPPA